MELKEYENKIGHPVTKMSYEEMLKYLEINQDKSTDCNLSYGTAYWLGRLFKENRITSKEYSKGLSILREALILHKVFHRIYLEIGDPTKDRAHWEFYLTEFSDE